MFQIRRDIRPRNQFGSSYKRLWGNLVVLNDPENGIRLQLIRIRISCSLIFTDSYTYVYSNISSLRFIIHMHEFELEE